MHYLLLLICAFFTVNGMPRFDPTATMQNILVPADAAVGTVIYRLRATDTQFNFPLSFMLEGENTVVSVQTLNCSRLNSVCQANVILQKKLTAGRFYDFIVALSNPEGTTIRIRCSFRATNATTPVADIFPGAPSLLSVSEDAKRNTELGTLIARGNPSRTKAVLLELWGSPLFGLRQRLINQKDAEAAIVLVGLLDYETQSSHHITVLANDAWTEPGNDTRNVATWSILIAVLDEQDTPPVFTHAPPVTILDPKIKPGDVILQVHAEDGDRGNPRGIRYGLASEGSPFTPFFNMSEETGELRLARPLSEIQAISHAGVPILLTVVAEEVRVSADERPALSASVQIALILPVPNWQTPRFRNELYTTSLKENSPPGTRLNLTDAEIIGDPGEVITLDLINNNGTFDITPSVIEGQGNFIIAVRDPRLLDYEQRSFVQCNITAKHLGSENTTYSLLIVNLIDVNDNPPAFLKPEWQASILENSKIGTSVLQIEAIDPDTKSSKHIRYTRLIGAGSQNFGLDLVSGLITVENSDELDAERVIAFNFSVEAADDDGKGLKALSKVTISLIDVNDNPPIFEKSLYEFIVSKDGKRFTSPAYVKATDTDVSAPNNVVRYELVSQIENITLNRDRGELLIRPVWKSAEMIMLKVRAYDEGVPRLWGECDIKLYPPDSRTREVTFIVPGLNPDKKAIEDELTALTGAQVTVKEIRPLPGNGNGEKDRSQVVATITYGPKTVIDVERIQNMYDKRIYTKEEVQQAGLAWPWWILIILLIIIILIIIILILCCICACCPLYIPPRKRKVRSGEISKLIIEGSGHGKNSKSVQVAEWFGRREAWTPEAALADAELDSLRRHEYERGSERGLPRRTVNKTQLLKEEPREQYIREGNADILRLITRGDEQQRPTTLVEQPLTEDAGKDILMRRFIDQQTTSRAVVNLPNEVNRSQIDQEQLEATLRQQNDLLRQILLEKERELRLETQSLPAGTQTDRDACTQTEPVYLRPPQRLTRSDNDASEGSDEETIVSKKREKHWRTRRKDSKPVKRKIRTPIQEESESNIETGEMQQNEESISSASDTIRTRLLRELLKESSTKVRPTRSAIRKEVLKEIAESLVRSQENVRYRDRQYDLSSADSLYRLPPTQVHNIVYTQASDNDIKSTNLDEIQKQVGNHMLGNTKKLLPEEGKSSLRKPHRYHSETDLSSMANTEQVQESKFISQADIRKIPKHKTKKGGSRYMEWYSKVQRNSASSKQPPKELDPNVEKPEASGVKKRQAALEAKNRKKNSQAITGTVARESPKPGPEHPLIQHSEHRFEIPLAHRRIEDDVDSGIALARPPIAEKKSVFSIAYEDIQRQTRQLRPESSTP